MALIDRAYDHGKFDGDMGVHLLLVFENVAYKNCFGSF